MIWTTEEAERFSSLRDSGGGRAGAGCVGAVTSAASPPVIAHGRRLR
jgi:hypothetical protein